MELLAVGGYGVGLSFVTDRMPGDGETLSGAAFSQEHGGKGSNQAVAASRLGASVGLLTVIGDDPMGNGARPMWSAEGVQYDAVCTVHGSTMVGCIITDARGENRILLADGVLADFDAARVSDRATAFDDVTCVLVSGEMAASGVQEALRQGRRVGARVILNPAPCPPITADDWANVDVVTPNRTEACQLLGRDVDDADDAADLATQLANRFQVDVVLTDGARGSLVATPGTPCQPIAPVAPRTVVDTTGAGDTFSAALAVALLRGKSLTEAAMFAAAAASFTVESPGVIPALPRLPAVEERLALV
ncbi:ribokinase [Gephyromycinifex aptenodytis]|uniref:ribokinase n=1 Tax=Gephyromycinifex aptenodytis TaxID=2716227 RepID=UPI001445B2F1|nr:ribokinase [Gephyromycinifex aptenodytis]